MSLWWIGVKDDGFKVFEATEAEAYSPEFENIYGVAFGQYRSREQAEADSRAHAGHLMAQANIVRAERAKKGGISVNTVEISAESVEKSKKAIKKLLRSEVTEGNASFEGETHSNLGEIDMLLKSLQGLKVAIARVLDAGVAFKRKVEEAKKNEDRKKG